MYKYCFTESRLLVRALVSFRNNQSTNLTNRFYAFKDPPAGLAMPSNRADGARNLEGFFFNVFILFNKA
jgi:hypothetical protein